MNIHVNFDTLKTSKKILIEKIRNDNDQQNIYFGSKYKQKKMK